MAGGLNEKEVSRCSIQTTGKQKPKGPEDWEDETDFFFVSVMLRVRKIEAYTRKWLLKIYMESELTEPLKSMGSSVLSFKQYSDLSGSLGDFSPLCVLLPGIAGDSQSCWLFPWVEQGGERPHTLAINLVTQALLFPQTRALQRWLLSNGNVIDSNWGALSTKHTPHFKD